MQCSAFLQFEHFTDGSIREYQSILDELRYSETFTYYASIILWPIMLAYLTPIYSKEVKCSLVTGKGLQQQLYFL